MIRKGSSYIYIDIYSVLCLKSMLGLRVLGLIGFRV